MRSSLQSRVLAITSLLLLSCKDAPEVPSNPPPGEDGGEPSLADSGSSANGNDAGSDFDAASASHAHDGDAPRDAAHEPRDSATWSDATASGADAATADAAVTHGDGGTACTPLISNNFQRVGEGCTSGAAVAAACFATRMCTSDLRDAGFPSAGPHYCTKLCASHADCGDGLHCCAPGGGQHYCVREGCAGFCQ